MAVDPQKIDLSVFDKAVKEKNPEIDLSVFDKAVKKKDGTEDLPVSSKDTPLNSSPPSQSKENKFGGFDPFEDIVDEAYADSVKNPQQLFNPRDNDKLLELKKKYKIEPIISLGDKISEELGLSTIPKIEDVSRRPFSTELEDVNAIEGAIKNKIKEKETQFENDRLTSYDVGKHKPLLDDIKKSKEELADIYTLRKKLAAELTIEGENEVDAVVRTDESGNNLNKTVNRLAAIDPVFSPLGKAAISLETLDKIKKLPPQFVTGLNYLKNVEPVTYQRVSEELLKGMPISESQVANITAQGIELEQARLQRNLQEKKIAPAEYNTKVTELNKVRLNNLLDNEETLRAFLSDGIAEKGDRIGKIEQAARSQGNTANQISDYLFGHTWNYSDKEIKDWGEQYATANGLDPQDKRVQGAIKYLQDNEGAMIMENSIAKAGGIRELFAGAAQPIRGIANSIEDVAKSSNDVYAEAQSQGNVNVSEKRLKAEDMGVRGVINDVVKGTGQFASQAGLAYLTSGAIGGLGKALLSEGFEMGATTAGEVVNGKLPQNIVGTFLNASKENLATFITSYGMAYDSNLKNALTYTSDNSLAKKAAAINSALEGATELFLSPLEIAHGIMAKFRTKGVTEGLLKVLSDEAVLQSPNKLRDYLASTLKGILGTAKVAGAEIGEEFVTQIADYVTNGYLNPNSESFKNRDLQNELAVTAYQTGLSMAVPALLNGIGASKANTFAKGSLMVAAQNRQALIDGLKTDLAKENITQQEFNAKSSLINTAAQANAQLPKKIDGTVLNTNEKADYIFSRVAEAVLDKRAKATKDAAEKNILSKKIKEQQEYRTNILGLQKEENVEPVYKIDGKDVGRATFLNTAKGENSDNYNFEVQNDEEAQNYLRKIGGIDEDISNQTNNTQDGNKKSSESNGESNSQEGSEASQSRSSEENGDGKKEVVSKDAAESTDNAVSLLDRVKEKKVTNYENTSLDEVKEQALQAPNSLNNILNDENLTTDLIADNSKEEIEKAIQYQQNRLGGNLTSQEITDIDNHIKLLEKGLAKVTLPELEDLSNKEIITVADKNAKALLEKMNPKVKEPIVDTKEEKPTPVIVVPKKKETAKKISKLKEKRKEKQVVAVKEEKPTLTVEEETKTEETEKEPAQKPIIKPAIAKAIKNIKNETDEAKVIKLVEDEAAAAEASEDPQERESAIAAIDEIIKGTPEQIARDKGEKEVNGTLVKRQEPIAAVKGKEVNILFSKEDSQPANYAVIELDNLQPSHKNGVKNDQHFIPEAQPRDRGALEVLKNEAKKKADSLDPNQLADNNIAYFGSPIVNTRGEVIQGNGRGEAIDYYYRNDAADSKGYKQMILNKSADLGLNAEEISQMKNPVLVRMANVSDEDAIVLGNQTSSDLEDVKEKDSDAKGAINKLRPSDLTQLSNAISSKVGENDTLKSSIRDNAKPIIDLLMNMGVLRADNREQYFTQDGVTPEGIEAAHNIVKHLIFEGAANDLSGKFDNLPFAAREAIEKTIPAILTNKELKGHVQSVIEILHDKQESGIPNFNTWAKQYDLFKGKMPMDSYSRADLALGKKIDEATTQKQIATIIKELAISMNGKPADMFDAQQEPLSFDDAVAANNIVFSVQDNTNEEVEEVKDLIKDLFDEGMVNLKDIQDYVAKELEDDSEELRDLVTTAYHEFGKTEIPVEITKGVIGQVGKLLSRLFGGTPQSKVYIARDTQSLMSKADELGDNVQYQASLKDYAKILTASLLFSTSQLNDNRQTNVNRTAVEIKKEDATEVKFIKKIMDDYYKVNNEIVPQDVVDRTIKVWERSGKPLLFSDSTSSNERAFAQNGERIVLGNITDFEDLVAELSHAAQYVSKAKLDGRVYATQDEYDKVEYDRVGSIEYDAHILIEGLIADYIINGTTPEVAAEKNNFSAEMLDRSFKSIQKYKLKDILFMQTQAGEILGFAYNGKIYLNGEKINPNTAIHEAGHIWNEWAKQNDKAVYDKGMELVIGSKYLDVVKSNKFYKEEAKKLPVDKREDYFKHEALAAAIGDRGAQFITESNKKGFKEWLNNLWEKIKSAVGFNNISAKDLSNLTFEQFVERAAADILRQEENNNDNQEEKPETEEETYKRSKGELNNYEMTTSEESNKFLSGKTIESIFGEAPAGSQGYYVQKLSDMLEDGKRMIGIAQGTWGTDIADYGEPLFRYIRSLDHQISNKKSVLLATFLGEMKEEMSRNEDRIGELSPLYNRVEEYYQNYMNTLGKSVVAGRLLRLYRDKYLGDVFIDRIMDEQQVRQKEDIRRAEEEAQRINDMVAEEISRITKEQKEQEDKEQNDKSEKTKKANSKKNKMSKDDAQKMAAAKMEELQKKGGLQQAIDKIKDAIDKLNCK